MLISRFSSNLSVFKFKTPILQKQNIFFQNRKFLLPNSFNRVQSPKSFGSSLINIRETYSFSNSKSILFSRNNFAQIFSSISGKTKSNWAKLIAVLALLWGATSSAFASDSEENSARENLLKQIDDLILVWRFYPYPEKFIDLFVQLANFDEAVASKPLGVFLAFIFASNPNKVEEWSLKIWNQSKRKEHLISLFIGLWLLQTPTSFKLLNKFLNDPSLPTTAIQLQQQFWEPLIPLTGNTAQEILKTLLNSKPSFDLSLDNLRLDSPDSLDVLWSKFLVTGEPTFVKKILTMLGPFIPNQEFSKMLQEKGATDPQVIGHLAAWSLSSNAKLHPDVLGICEDELASPTVALSKPSQAVLAAIVASVHDIVPLAVPKLSTFEDPRYGDWILNKKVKTLWNYGKDYPPHFQSSEEREEVKLLATQLAKYFDSKYFPNFPNSMLASHIFISCFNLDLPQAVIKNENGEITEIRAFKYLETALKFKPNDPYINMLTGIFCGQVGSHEKAEEFLLRSIDLGEKRAYLSLALLFAELDKEKATNYVKKYLEIFPTDENAKSFLKKIQLGKVNNKQ